MDPVLGHQQGHFLFIGIRKNIALVQAALDVVALGLLGKDHGHAVLLGADGSESDAAGLCGQHHRDILDVKIFGKFLRHGAHQGGVHAVVQESVHLDDIAGEHAALLQDTLFQLLHRRHFLSKVLVPYCPIFRGKATGKIEEYFSAFYGFLWVLPVKTGVLIVRISSA